MAQISVGTAATLLYKNAHADGAEIHVHNHGTVSVYLGDDQVTTSNGYEVAAGAEEVLRLLTGSVLYGVSGTAAQRVDVIGPS